MRKYKEQFLKVGGAAAAASRPLIKVVGGQTLYSGSGLVGVKYVTGALSGVPTYDISTLPTTVDGLGYGVLYGTTTPVWIVNYPPSTINRDLIAGLVAWGFDTLSIPITSGPSSGGTITAYILAYPG